MNQTMHVRDMAKKQLQAEQHGGEARREEASEKGYKCYSKHAGGTVLMTTTEHRAGRRGGRGVRHETHSEGGGGQDANMFFKGHGALTRHIPPKLRH